MSTGNRADEASAKAVDLAAWHAALVRVARHYRVDCSPEDMRQAAQWHAADSLQAVLQQMARQAGLKATFADWTPKLLNVWQLPLVIQLRSGQVAVLESLSSDGEAGLTFSGDQGLQTAVRVEALQPEILQVVILRPLTGVADARVDGYVSPYRENWFFGIVLRDLRPYGFIMLASLVANVLGLAGVLFSMQVYDRVVPAESYPTLYVLFGGVAIALLFDFIMRLMRMKIADVTGKRADMRISDLVFGHALRLRNSARPRSTGAFIAQLRELEQIRDLITSSTASALADFPFFLLFLLVFAVISGPLVWVPVAAFALLLIPGLLMQRPLARLANEAMRESSLRQATLVEAVQGIEDIKTLQAEHRFQQQWNHYNGVTAEVNLRLRTLVNRLVVWTHCVQGGVYAVVAAIGAPMVMAGEMTTGTLVAASILASRMMVPVTQISHVLSRWQQARTALQGLNSLMQLPVDTPESGKKVHCATIKGSYSLRQAGFGYGGALGQAALQISRLDIRPGEKIVILGRNGSGKSTLLQALAGGVDLLSGRIELDDVALGHIDPADLRRDVGLLTQNARLFHGSLRENLTLGAPQASDQEILEALRITGADEFVRGLPDGLHYPLQEGGLGLSGGQRQLLLLARLLIRNPRVILLDEPTASLDEMTERSLLNNLEIWARGRTLIMATHRMHALNLAQRVVVLEQGRIVIDDTRDNTVARLRKTETTQEQAHA